MTTPSDSNAGSGFDPRGLFKLGGAAALLAMAANLLDVILGLGDSEMAAYGGKTAVEWFAIFQAGAFRGLYVLGILNIVYQACLLPVYAAMIAAHRGRLRVYTALAAAVFGIGMAVYVSNSAALPMADLSARYASAPEAGRGLIAAAGEAVLAKGEDFTPGSFIGLILGGLAALGLSWVMLKGRVFPKPAAWAGLIGFSLLSVFTVVATFFPQLYKIAFPVCGMIGGLLALAWFVLVALRFFKLGRGAIQPS